MKGFFKKPPVIRAREKASGWKCLKTTSQKVHPTIISYSPIISIFLFLEYQHKDIILALTGFRICYNLPFALKKSAYGRL